MAAQRLVWVKNPDLFRHHRSDVDLEQHTLDRQSVDDEERVHRDGSARISFVPALADRCLGADVGDIDHLLDDICQSRALRREKPFNLVVRVEALLVRRCRYDG